MFCRIMLEASELINAIFKKKKKNCIDKHKLIIYN